MPIILALLSLVLFVLVAGTGTGNAEDLYYDAEFEEVEEVEETSDADDVDTVEQVEEATSDKQKVKSEAASIAQDIFDDYVT